MHTHTHNTYIHKVSVAAPRLSGRPTNSSSTNSSSGYSDCIDEEGIARARGSGVYIPMRKSAADIKTELDEMEMRYMSVEGKGVGVDG